LIELTCEECNLVYKRRDTDTKHTENICLRKQVTQFRNESNENQRVMQDLLQQLNKIHTLQST
jgi:hypothetical protein